MSVSRELNEDGYLFDDNPSSANALGRSLRELNGVGYHSEILATPATVLSPFCELKEQGYLKNRSRVQIPPAARTAAVAQFGRAILQLPVRLRAHTFLRAEVKRLSTCNREVAGSSPARGFGSGSSVGRALPPFRTPCSHLLRAEGLTVIQPRTLDEPSG